MDMNPSATEKQDLISQFLEIAVGQSAQIATQFLQATGWKLVEAIQLFYIGYEGGGVPPSALAQPDYQTPSERVSAIASDILGEDVGEDGVRAPLPVKRETLYGDASFSHRLQPTPLDAFRNFNEESKRPAVWESDKNSASPVNGSHDNLAALYRPPFALMFNGPFDKAKIEASLQDKWLLINLQSTEEFSSHMLNRDTWSHEAVAQTIRTNFIFWQVYHNTSEGKRVCLYYNLVSVPAILVVDPITGQKMRAWSGMIQAERLLEELLQFMDRGPKEHHISLPHKRPRETAESSALKIPDKTSEEEDDEVSLALAMSLEDTKGSIGSPVTDGEPQTEKDAKTCSIEKPSYPPLPEEPTGNRELVCKVGIRLPEGRRVQRNFLRTDPIKLLWSFCSSLLEDEGVRPFHFTQGIPGATKNLNYDNSLTFEEAGLSNSMISLTWD